MVDIERATRFHNPAGHTVNQRDVWRSDLKVGECHFQTFKRSLRVLLEPYIRQVS